MYIVQNSYFNKHGNYRQQSNNTLLFFNNSSTKMEKIIKKLKDNGKIRNLCVRPYIK